MLIYTDQIWRVAHNSEVSSTGNTLCLLRGFMSVLENGTPKLSRNGCPFVDTFKNYTLCWIAPAVSFVHKRSNTVEATVCQAQEREVEGIEAWLEQFGV